MPHLSTFCSCGLMVDGTVDGKVKKKEKTREVADIGMYNFGWNLIELGCDRL